MRAIVETSDEGRFEDWPDYSWSTAQYSIPPRGMASKACRCRSSTRPSRAMRRDRVKDAAQANVYRRQRYRSLFSGPRASSPQKAAASARARISWSRASCTPATRSCSRPDATSTGWCSDPRGAALFRREDVIP